MIEEKDKVERNLGTQPLDAILNNMGLSNKELVAVSTEQITHKMVSRGRKGRLLTRNVQRKLLNAINKLDKGVFSLSDIFNYHGT